MSGGAYDYAYVQFERFADELEARKIDPDPARAHSMQMFVEHLRAVARVAKLVEWVASGDRSEPEDTDAIRALLP